MKLSKSRPIIKPKKRLSFSHNPIKKNYSSIISPNITPSTLKELLKKDISLINLKDSYGQTFLSYAIEYNNNEIINLLLNYSSLDLTYTNKSGNTYIHLAVIYNNISLVEKLIKKNIDLNKINNEGNTCLHLAYLYNNNEIIDLLIKNGANINFRNNNNKKPEEMQILNISNINYDKNSELSNSTQLEWVKSAIEVKTKNNEIIKLSLNDEFCFEQKEDKINKIDENKNPYNKEIKNDYKYKNDNIENKTNNNIDNSEKIYNKESGYMMVSTKESEKNDNIKYLSNRRKQNIEISYTEKNNNNNNNDNNEEDIVNMKTLSLFEIKPEINNINKILNKDNIYIKHLNMGFYSKKKSKMPFRSKFIEIQKNNFINNKKYYFKVEKNNKNIKFCKTKNNSLYFKSLDKTYENNNIHINNSYNNKISFKNDKFHHCEDNLDNKRENSLGDHTPYLYKKKENNTSFNNIKLNLTEYYKNKFPLSINKERPRGSDYYIKSCGNHYINNNNIQSHKYINTNINNFNNAKKHLSKAKLIKKIIRKNISHKFLLSSNDILLNSHYIHKSNLLLKNFLTQINMQKYYSTLKENGYDNINLLIIQMKSDMPITDLELKKAGIKIPGDRAKILIRLEEKGNIFPFEVPKNVYYHLDDNINIDEDENINKLKKWLKEFKMENYLDNFIKSGYYSIELFLFQMISKNPINNDILKNEIGIDKIGHRSRILSILNEESKNIQENIEKRGNSINIMNEVKNCGCLIF